MTLTIYHFTNVTNSQLVEQAWDKLVSWKFKGKERVQTHTLQNMKIQWVSLLFKLKVDYTRPRPWGVTHLAVKYYRNYADGRYKLYPTWCDLTCDPQGKRLREFHMQTITLVSTDVLSGAPFIITSTQSLVWMHHHSVILSYLVTLSCILNLALRHTSIPVLRKCYLNSPYRHHCIKGSYTLVALHILPVLVYKLNNSYTGSFFHCTCSSFTLTCLL